MSREPAGPAQTRPDGASAPAPDSARSARAAMRSLLFRSGDGLVLCATLRALDELGILEPSLAADHPLAELQPDLDERGFGSIRVGMRSLAGVGWLDEQATMDPGTAVLRWSEAGRLAMRHRDLYVEVGRFLARFDSADDDAWSRPWGPDQVSAYGELTDRARERWGLDAELPAELEAMITIHLNGGLLAPSMLSLLESGRIAEQGPSLPEGELGEAMGRLLLSVGWVEPGGEWSESGRHARDFAFGYAAVLTYAPLLARLPELYRGELTVASGPESDGAEWHIHRRLNLAAATVAHQRYFADADPIFQELFARLPEDRPRFIADMGCGDGSWLLHLHGLLAASGGSDQGAEPPLLVGIDCSPTALEQAREKFEAAGVDGMLLVGDVTDPGAMGEALAEHDLRMEDGLHIRAFLDHDRDYLGADAELGAPGWATGAYIDRAGRPLDGASVERDLIAHLRRWAPHVGRHGLVVLEAHCVAPEIIQRHLGALHSNSFDAYQAYSQQYPVDHASFLQCCREAGLRLVPRHERRYPSSRPFVTISLNRLVADQREALPPASAEHGQREDTWRPEPGTDLEDGRALHEMLFAGGDIANPRMWHAAATGFVVAGALEAIESRLAEVAPGEVIRVLDYGAGTGTATIELLKACREREIERELELRGASLELHLVDLPSGWFAQGFELLRDSAWTRFHSLSGGDRRFRPLLEVTGGRTMDAVMVNMVFHLIPPRAFGRAAAELASVTAPEGRLLFSAPDLGPAGRHTVPMHDITRATRVRWLELLDGADGGPLSAEVVRAARGLHERLDPATLRRAQERAERHILAHPAPAAEVAAALESHLSGELELRGYEMLEEDIVNGSLVPSNQAQFMGEIGDRDLRERVIRELLTKEVIPGMQTGPAGTAHGLNLHWTLGAFTKRS